MSLIFWEKMANLFNHEIEGKKKLGNNGGLLLQITLEVELR
jgi:hypothetical protein